MPKLRGATFRTAVIERYRRRETSVEEAIVEMYLAGVSTRRIEDVSELPWGGAGVHREDGARRVRRDACLHGIPAGALAPDQVERRGRRINREIRRRTKVVGTFPDGNSTLMLVTARLKFIVKQNAARGDAWIYRSWTRWTS